MRRALFLIAPVVAIGVCGAVVAVASHESDAAFLYRQQHPITIEPTALETLVKKASDPEPNGGRAPARSVSCQPGGSAQQRNPWHCTVDYASGHVIRYRINVRPNGAYEGVDPTGQFVISGCCVPGAAPSGA